MQLSPTSWPSTSRLGQMEEHRIDRTGPPAPLADAGPEFVCDDGSGTFLMKLYSRVDFAEPELSFGIPTREIP